MMSENQFFPELKGKLGFGGLRFPKKWWYDYYHALNKLSHGRIRFDVLSVDLRELRKMIDCYMERGFNYFDTGHKYMLNHSEPALRECLVKRYPRDSFVFTDKLTASCFKTNADIRPLFEKQLKACGLDYFDFYLMHAQREELYKKFMDTDAYSTALELKDEGKIRHFGISFHDSPELLEKILTDWPQIEVVQLQFNYMDYDSSVIASKACYDVCVRHRKPVFVMEPVKGGNLTVLPDDAKAVFQQLGSNSPASYAIRFAAGFENICMVLSGMSTLQQTMDNTAYMQNFTPLSEEELEAVWKVRDIIQRQSGIQCTACRYCTEVCPKGIPTPDIFTLYNQYTTQCENMGNRRITNYELFYRRLTKSGNTASSCVKCGKCETVCPQHLPIRKYLEQAAQKMER